MAFEYLHNLDIIYRWIIILFVIIIVIIIIFN